MRVNREAILTILESVSPGLAAKEILEQSSCLVFTGEHVVTFNDEVSARRDSPLRGIRGAVKAKPLLELLSRLTEDDLEIEQAQGELLVSGKRRKAGVRMEAEVLLPVESIEQPREWRPLSIEFSEAVSIVHSCASHEASQFVLTCVHLHPDFMEACDRFQMARYPLETGVQEEVLVRADSLKSVLGYDMNEISETESWVHFRNPGGLVLSIRRYLDDYRSLDSVVSAEGLTQMTLPGGLEEVVSMAEIFSGENAIGNHVQVELRPDRIVIAGSGASGWFKEMKKVTYGGPEMKFLIAPKLLLAVAKKSETCGVSQGRLVINSGKFVYVTSTMHPEEQQVAEPAAS